MEDSQILTILKIVVMIVFFVIVIIFGTLPIRSKTFKRRPLLKAIGATFAGCLFLNVAIMHILPEAADTLEDFLKGDDQDKEVFPLAYLLLMVGFIITVFFTKVLSFHSHEEDHEQQNEQNGEVSQDTDSSPRKKRIKEQFPEIGEANENENIKKSLLSENNQSDKLKKTLSTPAEAKGIKSIQRHHSHEGHNHNHDHSHSHKHGHVHVHSSQHSDPKDHILKNKSMLNQAFILTIAIYFHTIFEGIAIGVQNSVTGFLSTAVAIAFHKWADALSMGCHYKSKNVQKKLSYALIIVQAILNVLSIGLGWVISSSGDVVEAVFLSISAGTFLAISTIQMLGQQLHHRQYMPIKFALLVGATGFVASIWFLENSIFNQ